MTRSPWLDRDYPHQELTSKILAAAIQVHKKLGPGFIESIYENALVIELEKRGMKVQRQVILPVHYDDPLVGKHRADLIVEELVVLELKSAADLLPVHQAQTRSTLMAANLRVALLINFNVSRLMDGVKRIVNSGETASDWQR